MNIDKNFYRNLSISNPDGYTNAGWVTVYRSPERKAWRAVCVHKLTGQENDRNHHVYVDLLSESGDFLANPQERLAYSWKGQRPDERSQSIRLDKPAYEPAGNVPVFKGAEFEVWIDSSYPSDHVSNLTTDLPDEDEGNTRFHHSYYIIFKLVDSTQASEPTVSDVDLLTGVGDLIATLESLKTTVEVYLKRLREL